MWDKFTPELKAIILGIMLPDNSNTQTNVTDHSPALNTDDGSISVHRGPPDIDNETSLSPNDVTDTNKETSSSETLLVHLTNQNGVHPGDLHRVLSQTSNSKGQFGSSKHPTALPNTKPGSQIVLNGKTYRMVDVSKIT